MTGVDGAWSDAELCDVMESMRDVLKVVSCGVFLVEWDVVRRYVPKYSMLLLPETPRAPFMNLVSSGQHLQVSTILATIAWYQT